MSPLRLAMTVLVATVLAASVVWIHDPTSPDFIEPQNMMTALCQGVIVGLIAFYLSIYVRIRRCNKNTPKPPVQPRQPEAPSGKNDTQNKQGQADGK